ncbi:MAG: phosphatase PAP2 family protein [Myxococcales bacterium]|jgi:membrane-associated phospholipid phosphatase|nr:phosphatase PAP2 family protein [Myxococcales bacterium]
MNAIALLTLCSLLSTASFATAPELDPREDLQLRYDWYSSGGIILFAGSALLASELLKAEMAPANCRWCGRNALDDSVTRALAWNDIGAASKVGDLFAYVAMPLATAGTLALVTASESRFEEMPLNLLIMAETLVLSMTFNQIVKYAVGRERPFVAELSASEKSKTSSPADNNLSFYSAHSSVAFALAVSAGTIAHLRGYEAEPYVWAIGLPMAAFVAYSRIGAKKHYLTDVLVGSVAGAAFGFAIPWLLHRPKSAQRAQGPAVSTSYVFLPSGFAIAGTFP